MEACGSAHHWARKLDGFGHTLRLMAPQFVKPYVKANKNDAADAEAICEAVARPNMRFVPIKNIEQQSVLSLHRVRQGFVKARTAQGNQIRGLLEEFGLIIPQGIANIAKRVPELIEDASNELSVSLQAVTFGLSFCHRQFRGAFGSRALCREHPLAMSLGRRWSVPRFRPLQLAQPCI